MRLHVLLLLALAVPVEAVAQLRAGGDLGLLFREEAGGNRSVLPALSPRASFEVAKGLDVAAAWTFAYASAGAALGSASTLHHRVVLKLEYGVLVGSARFHGGLGPACTFMHTTLYDRGEAKVSSTIVRPGVGGGLGVDVDVDRFRLRAGLDVVHAAGRLDLTVLLGATVPLGGP